ncbi:hypothetical protein TNCV_173971 [Trichonephila clavipes]|nr:hypothetical protein TNCV_173971 [Trichonephila clavipes]
MQVRVGFWSVPSQFRRRKPWEWLPTSLPLPATLRENLRLDGYLEYPPATKALYIYKHPCLLQDSSPVPTAQQSASRLKVMKLVINDLVLLSTTIQFCVLS